MRIISGLFKSRFIKPPRLDGIRITKDSAKEALFNIIAGHIRGATFLDLFSGSGNVGIEALSRGAGYVVFVEKEIICLRAIRDNLALLGLLGSDRIEVVAQDAFKTVKMMARAGKMFDIIFADPPYYGNLAKKILIKLLEYDILTPNSFIIIEHHKSDKLADVIESTSKAQLKIFRRQLYGDTAFSFYKKLN